MEQLQKQPDEGIFAACSISFFCIKKAEMILKKWAGD